MKMFANISVTTGHLLPISPLNIKIFLWPTSIHKNVRLVRLIRHLFKVKGTRVLGAGPLKRSINVYFG